MEAKRAYCHGKTSGCKRKLTVLFIELHRQIAERMVTVAAAGRDDAGTSTGRQVQIVVGIPSANGEQVKNPTKNKYRNRTPRRSQSSRRSHKEHTGKRTGNCKQRSDKHETKDRALNWLDDGKQLPLIKQSAATPT
ncbi:hypothetical protein DPX16_21006 [Anabarilius grahami]|uniref:Uncharacterized protein n=1 Tax=Anabarilius grahami TaxID=495550 RepID=A0A3N0YW68_ANAGA|nr:hypothetical protein DPX16_21006 [Anabarilius grahami]